MKPQRPLQRDPRRYPRSFLLGAFIALVVIVAGYAWTSSIFRKRTLQKPHDHRF